MKTITGREIEVKENEKELAFDITVDVGTDNETTYRTIEMDKDEFENCENNTANDWQHFLKSDDYYEKLGINRID